MDKLLVALIIVIIIAIAVLAGRKSLRIATINLEDGGAGYEKEFGELFSQYDIVIAREVNTHSGDNNAALIAKNIGWYSSRVVNDCAVLSRYPVESIAADGKNLSHTGTLILKDLIAVIVRAPKPVIVFPVHLNDEPYQPFSVLGVKYKTDADRLSADIFVKTPGGPIDDSYTISAHAQIARGAELSRVLKVADEIYAANGIPQIIAGDFNEPSHLDWTARAIRAGVVPIEVAYPASMQMQKANFTDTYRAVYPDEIVYMGSTWPTSHGKVLSELTMWDDSPISNEHGGIVKRYLSARIDYIYVRDAYVLSSERKLTSSDHYALGSVIRI